MKGRSLRLACAILLLVLLIGGLSPYGTGQAGTLAQSPPAGQLIKQAIPSPSLPQNLLGYTPQKQVTIYLPPSYGTSSKKYPVVYFLPGYGDYADGYTKGRYQGFRLRETMDQFISDGIIREMIVVIQDGQHSLGGSFYSNSPVTGNWEDFIAKDVVGYIDTQYRTIRSSNSRGIAGHSMGGYGALNIAMLHPDIFGSVYSLSPGLFDPEGLSNSQMFHSPSIINAFLNLESRLAAMTREAALTEFLSVMRNSGNSDLSFTINYGMAFSPNPDKNAPYINYPYRREDGNLVLDERIWKTWEAGFGGIPEEVQQYRDNLLSLRAIAVDYGTRDEVQWIPQGCRFFSQVLTEANIPHELLVHNGGHQNLLGERIEQHMLPFFSTTLVFTE